MEAADENSPRAKTEALDCKPSVIVELLESHKHALPINMAAARGTSIVLACMYVL